MAKSRDLVERFGNEVYNWFDGITKKMQEDHPGITWGYDKKDKMWVVASSQNTVILRMGIDPTNKVFVYEYMADLGGKLGLKTGSTKEKGYLKTLLSKLEEVDAYNK